jgi:ADP-ribosyl-[dinitrogen reductase] hydrolase
MFCKNVFDNKVFGSIMGLAIGDALGAPVEFKKRGEYSSIEIYQSGGEFNLPAGFWTDDTTLALCILESLIQKDGFNLTDQMNNFLKWWEYGFLSSTGKCFDIGNTTKAALNRYKLNGNPLAGLPTDPATNGALMRLAPVPIFFHHSLSDSIKYSILQTKATHAPIECVEASMLLAYVIYFALSGKNKFEILKFTHFEMPLETRLAELKSGLYKSKLESEISGSGQAFTTLEAAFYAFFKFDNFLDGLKFVVNLGDDTDTVGAVYGQIAGAYYGINDIPEYYIEKLFEKEMIMNKIEKLLEKIK